MSCPNLPQPAITSISLSQKKTVQSPTTALKTPQSNNSHGGFLGPFLNKQTTTRAPRLQCPEKLGPSSAASSVAWKLRSSASTRRGAAATTAALSSGEPPGPRSEERSGQSKRKLLPILERGFLWIERLDEIWFVWFILEGFFVGCSTCSLRVGGYWPIALWRA